MADSKNPQLRHKLPRTFNDAAGNNPNKWFIEKFPVQVKQYGPPFVEAYAPEKDQIILTDINEDFFAAMLGGDDRLNLRVVYYPPEDTYYFFDWQVDAYVPTTEQKLGVLLSNYLVRCASACSGFADPSALMSRFRSTEVTKGILVRSRAILQADESFFKTESGNKRFINGRMVHPTDLPSYRLFVKEAIVPEKGSKLIEKDAWSRYFQFCKVHGVPPLTRGDFRSLIAEAIREEFHIGPRKDVEGDDGHQHRGWVGISYRQPAAGINSCKN